MNARDNFAQDGQKLIDLYSQLQSQIFKVIIDTIKDSNYKHVSQDDVVTWQVTELQKLGMLNRQVAGLVAKADGISKQAIVDLIKFHGYKIIEEVDEQLADFTGNDDEPVSKETVNILNALIDQTWTDLSNNVNESLITRNYGSSAVTKAYRRILTDSTLATLSGTLTHDKAVKQAIYRMTDRGLPTRLVDKSGRNWSIDGYTKMVVNTTVNRTYNALRLQRMKDYDLHLALMSSHPNSRPACAYIQGHVVNLVPPGDPNYDDKYDSIYNHGYGTPAGTQGINCSHVLFPYRPGVSTNHQIRYDPEEAIANGKLVQEQRARERSIRDAKRRLEAAKNLDDELQIIHSKALIRARQAKLRQFIKDTNESKGKEILVRDYDREQIMRR